MNLEQPGAVERTEQVGGSIELCRQRVLAQALRWKLRQEDAEDIAQEAALRLVRWPHLAQYPSGRWVSRLARQCAAAHAKVHRPHEALEAELVCAREPVSEPERGRIRSALAQLSTQEAQLVLMRYALGWPILEIAGSLGMSVAAVKKGSFRARNRLRCVLIDLIGSC